MDCQFLGSRLPMLRTWHRVVCSECRKAKSLDEILRRGIARINAETPPVNGLELTLAAVSVAPTPARRQSRRLPSFLTPGLRPVATLMVLTTVGAASWLAYADINPIIAVPPRILPSPNAYDILNRAYAEIPASEQTIDSTDGTTYTEYKNSKVEQALKPMPTALQDSDRYITAGHNYPTAPPSVDHNFALAKKEAILKEYAPSVRILRQSFAFPYREPRLASFLDRWQEYSNSRQLARVLSLDSKVLTEKGDIGAAFNSGMDAVELGAMLSAGGNSNGVWTGTACGAIGRAQLWPLIERLSAVQASAAARRMERIYNMRVSYADMLLEEKWSTIARLQDAFQRGNWRAAVVGSTFPAESAPGVNILYYFVFAQYSKSRVMSDYVRLMDAEIAMAQRPYQPIAPTPAFESFEASHDRVLLYLWPSYQQARFNETNGSDAPNALLMAALAVRAYEAEHHCLPARLLDVTPNYLTAIPVDPFGKGQVIRYKPKKHDIWTFDGSHRSVAWLYSVGPDGVDNGGRPVQIGPYRTSPMPDWPLTEWDKRSFNVTAESKGDIVAGVNTN